MSEYDVELSHGMHVVHDGPRQAPPVLLIHGSGASGAFWSPVVPALAGHHHVIRVDLPGCGQSPPTQSYDVPAQAGRVVAFLDDLGLRHVAVVGHSSGGYVATALAEQRPDLVRSLALISTGPSYDALLPQPFILRVLLAPPFGPLLWSRRSDAMIRSGLRTTAALPVDIPDDLVAEVRGITYRAFRTVLRKNRAYITERSVPERLTALEVPVLVIFGDADPRWEPSLYDTRGRHERGSVVVGLLPGDLRAAGWGAGECLQIRLEPVAAAAMLGASTELSGTVVPLEDVWAATPGEPRTGCAPPRRGTNGSRSRSNSSADGWAPAHRSIRRSPTPGGGHSPAGGGCGSTAWRTRSAGAASACGPAFGPSSASRPNTPPDWCGSTTPPTFSRRVTPPPALPSRAATSTSPTSTARSRRSPGLRPRPWPLRRGSRSTTLRGRLHRRPGAV